MFVNPNDQVVIETLRPEDISQIDRVFREAFCLQVKHPDVETFAPGRSCLARLVVEPQGGFGAFVQGKLVAVAFASTWGSVGVFGPLAVMPTSWNAGLGQLLLAQAISYFQQRAVKDMVLCTFPDSPKHIALYTKFGFHPRFLITMMSKSLSEDVVFEPSAEGSTTLLVPLVSNKQDQDEDTFELYSAGSDASRERALEECRALTNAVYDGLDLTKEIEVVEKLSIGETVLLRDKDAVRAFAICHHGVGSETETDVLYIKFAAVLPNLNAGETFRILIRKCYSLAKSKGASVLYFGVNTARQEAYEAVLSEGFKIDSISVAMQLPNHDCYNHGGIYVIDDWR